LTENSALQKRRGGLPAVSQLATIAFVLLLGIIEISCGDTYRPVAIPVLGPQPNPAAFHYVMAVSTNGNQDPGAATHIDVSGDTNVGVIQTGVLPTHAAVTPNGARFYAANRGEDTVTANLPSSASTVTATITLPAGSQPVFVHTTENANVYVAEFGANSVSVIDTLSNVVRATVPVGTHPIAMAETPNGQKLYVANQGSGNVTVINTADDSVATTITVGPSPAWLVARSDNARIYVLDGNGTIYDIDTVLDSVIGTASSGGSGANFMLYDRTANSLLVTNSSSGSLSVLNAVNDPPTLRAGTPITITAAAGSACASAAIPVSVTVLPDGRAYVASYQAGSGTVCSQISVVDSVGGVLTKTIPLTSVPDVSSQSGCSSARFRVFAVSSGGGSTSNFKVYASQCDAGSVAVINTYPVNSNPADVYSGISVTAPLSSFPPLPSSLPPLQNPVFVVAGP
jgi:YVTN family beta-propeller protein